MTTTLDSLRLLSRAYTRPMLTQLARTGDARAVTDLLLAHGQVGDDVAGLRLDDLFERGWSLLASRYRNEYVYKNELATRLVFKRHSPRTASFQDTFLAVRQSCLLSAAVVKTSCPPGW